MYPLIYKRKQLFLHTVIFIQQFEFLFMDLNNNNNSRTDD